MQEGMDFVMRPAAVTASDTEMLVKEASQFLVAGALYQLLIVTGEQHGNPVTIKVDDETVEAYVSSVVGGSEGPERIHLTARRELADELEGFSPLCTYIFPMRTGWSAYQAEYRLRTDLDRHHDACELPPPPASPAS